MSVTIALVGTPFRLFDRPYYLVQFNPDAKEDDEFMIIVDDERPKARRFRDMKEAMEYYRQELKCAPVRSDGEPNRPLTAYTILVEEVAEDA